MHLTTKLAKVTSMNKLIPIFLVVAVLIVVGTALYRRTTKSVGTTSGATSVSPIADAINSPPDTPEAQENKATPAPAKEISLDVTQPANNSTVASARITLKGKTVPKAEVFVNEYDLKADVSGNFSYTLTLDEGENIIIVMANDENGNVAEKELIVTYEPVE